VKFFGLYSSWFVMARRRVMQRWSLVKVNSLKWKTTENIFRVCIHNPRSRIILVDISSYRNTCSGPCTPPRRPEAAPHASQVKRDRQLTQVKVLLTQPKRRTAQSLLSTNAMNLDAVWCVLLLGAVVYKHILNIGTGVLCR